MINYLGRLLSNQQKPPQEATKTQITFLLSLNKTSRLKENWLSSSPNVKKSPN